VKQRQISSFNIAGNSKNTIRYLVSGSSPKDIHLKIIMDHIHLSLWNLKVQFYHVLRQHNFEDDKMANKAIRKTLVSWRQQER